MTTDRTDAETSRKNAIDAAIIEATSTRGRVFVFNGGQGNADGQGKNGYFAVHEEECSVADMNSAEGHAVYDPNHKDSVWIA